MQNKQTFIGQVFTSKTPARSMDDIDETALTYAETKAIAAGDDRIREKMELATDVSKLKVLRSHHVNTCHKLEDKVVQYYPQKIAETQSIIQALKRDQSTLSHSPLPTGDYFKMEVRGITHSERKTAGESLIQCCHAMKSKGTTTDQSQSIGEFCGFDMTLTLNHFGTFAIELKDEGLTHRVELGESATGNITRICNLIEQFEEKIENQGIVLEKLEKELVSASVQCKNSFPPGAEYQDKNSKLEALSKVLGGDKKSRTSEEIQGRIEAQATRLSNKEEKEGRKEEQKALFKAEKKAVRQTKSKTPKKKKQQER